MRVTISLKQDEFFLTDAFAVIRTLLFDNLMLER